MYRATCIGTSAQAWVALIVRRDCPADRLGAFSDGLTLVHAAASDAPLAVGSKSPEHTAGGARRGVGASPCEAIEFQPH